MAYVRQDIFTGRYVIIAAARGNRPITIKREAMQYIPDFECPFCAGNEQLTPPALFEEPSPWHIRSFPNKYPVLSEAGTASENEAAACDTGFYPDINNSGRHEVLVDTPHHHEDFSQLSQARMQDTLAALQQRHGFYLNLPEQSAAPLRHIQIFKNSGLRAGASQPHSHWQILASAFVPAVHQQILNNLRARKEADGQCLYCAAIAHEQQAGSRIVYENDTFLALCPYAPRFTYEVWILPKVHYSNFSALPPEALDKLAETMYKIFSAYRALLNEMSYNILLMEAAKAADAPLFHWHIQILPRIGTLAGYEFSTGTYINHIAPEFAAKQLREKLGGLSCQTDNQT